MRRRLLTSTLGVVFVAVLILGVPLALVGTQLIHNEAQQRVERDARNVAAVVEDRLEHGAALDASRVARLAPSDTEVSVTPPGGRSVVGGARLTGDELTATIHTSQGATVRVAASYAPVRARITEALLVVAGLVVLSGALAIGLAVLQARRLAGPLVELELSAARLGAGDFRARSTRSGVPEIDRVANVLDASGDRIAELLRREREFASDASHQLRTPLTAVSMRLEEIVQAESWSTVREEAEAALAQTERLTCVIEQLLRAARDTRAQDAVVTDVSATVAAEAADWLPTYRRTHRRFVVEDSRELRALCAPGTLAQALSTLFDNALRHGAGTVTVRARPAGDYVRVEVSDEGAGVPESLVPRIFERSVSGGSGTGLGLALARALVEADGGRLELVQPRPSAPDGGGRPTTFAVFLRTGYGAAHPR